MSQEPLQYIESSKKWLSESVFPLWIQKGIDTKNGSFVEALSFQGQPSNSARRAMVQARQIYAFAEAAQMNILSFDIAQKVILHSADYLVSHYSLPSGAFVHSLSPQGKVIAGHSELYTQAFVLFGLAKAFAITQQDRFRLRAQKLLAYLNRERRAPYGGYIEIKEDIILYQSNPHMHLFEAAIAWMAVDSGPEWVHLAKNLFELSQTHLFVSEEGVIAEYFDQDWRPLEEEGLFVFEPGHQYEWAWLLLEFQKYTQVSVGTLPERLFKMAEQYGRRPSSDFVVDEVWSNMTFKKTTSRFWPQCERIKAAVALGELAPAVEQIEYAEAADQGFRALNVYLQEAPKGLWHDTLLETGEFITVEAKASSLYHIINAFSEYSQKRLRIDG